MCQRVFQSTPPVKAATDGSQKSGAPLRISIHAACEGGDDDYVDYRDHCRISIHAACEGGDEGSRKIATCDIYFNPRRL